MCIPEAMKRKRGREEERRGKEEPEGGGGASGNEVNQPGLCLLHFLTCVKVNECGEQGSVSATMGLCCSEKARMFGVTKGCAEVRLPL